jgi:hypothetical protein
MNEIWVNIKSPADDGFAFAGSFSKEDAESILHATIDVVIPLDGENSGYLDKHGKFHFTTGNSVEIHKSTRKNHCIDFRVFCQHINKALSACD